MRTPLQHVKNFAAGKITHPFLRAVALDLLDAYAEIERLKRVFGTPFVELDKKLRDSVERVRELEEHLYLKKSLHEKYLKARDNAIDLAKTILVQKDERIKSLEYWTSIKNPLGEK